MSRKCVILIFLLISNFLFSQECENVRAEYDNNKVYIYYDLVTAPADAKCFVSAYISKDSFNSPLKYVSGAVGVNVTPGENLKIVWDCKKEFSEINLSGIDFKVSATKDIPAAYFQVLVTGKFKRNGNIKITWISGTSGEDITIDLLKKGFHYKRIMNTIDMGSFDWTIPDNVEKGSEYQIRIMNNYKNELYSVKFEIK